MSLPWPLTSARFQTDIEDEMKPVNVTIQSISDCKKIEVLQDFLKTLSACCQIIIKRSVQKNESSQK